MHFYTTSGRPQSQRSPFSRMPFPHTGITVSLKGLAVRQAMTPFFSRKEV